MQKSWEKTVSKLSGTFIKNLIIVILVSSVLGASVGCAIGVDISNKRDCIYKRVDIELGTGILLDYFLKEPLENAAIHTDISGIDTKIPGSYGLVISFEDFGKTFYEDVVLNVVDTTAPMGEPVPTAIYSGSDLPADRCIENIQDMSDVSVSYDGEPDLVTPGQRDIPIALTDASGNKTIVNVPFLIVDDHLAPLLYGVHDMEYFIGDSISYLDGITITDNYDPLPDIFVDNSSVNLTEPGVYPITYIASDEQGNTATWEATLTLREKPERYYESEELYELASALNEQYGIYDEDMTDIQKAFRIFSWVYDHIHYVGTSDKSDYTCAAYDALTTLTGDCYSDYAICKVFLDMEGIPNLLVTRDPITWSAHYWNLVYLDGQWWHCDACSSSYRTGVYFMYAQDDLNPYSHCFDISVYDSLVQAEMAQESIQGRVNYSTLEVETL